MKPVKQTRFGEEGNCFQACIASILELELDEVPDFVNDYEDWWSETCLWLEKNGYLILYNGPIYHDNIGIIGCGLSPREFNHATIVDFDLNFIHDPHPDSTGVEDITHYFALYVV